MVFSPAVLLFYHIWPLDTTLHLTLEAPTIDSVLCGSYCSMYASGSLTQVSPLSEPSVV